MQEYINQASFQRAMEVQAEVGFQKYIIIF